MLVTQPIHGFDGKTKYLVGETWTFFPTPVALCHFILQHVCGRRTLRFSSLGQVLDNLDGCSRLINLVLTCKSSL